MTRIIALANWKGEAIVDDDDYPRLSRFRWYRLPNGYVATKTKDGHHLYMHREVMHTPPGKHTDHVDGNKLDNRKSNLRICSKSENLRNRGKQTNNTSGYKGVFYSIRAHRWRAQIVVERKAIHLGLFDTTVEAAQAYNEAAAIFFGPFAKLNVIPSET